MFTSESTPSTAFFIRSLMKRGYVVTASAQNGVSGQPMLPQNPNTQLFESLPNAADPKSVALLNESGALTADKTGKVFLNPFSPDNPFQQWLITADGQYFNAGLGTDVVMEIVTADGGNTYSYQMLPPDPFAAPRTFEQVLLTSYQFIRDSSTGLFLTGTEMNTNFGKVVSWLPLNPTSSLYQQWAITPSGYYVCRANALVLQSLDPGPGSPLAMGLQVDFMPNGAWQRFQFNTMERRIFSEAGDLVVGVGVTPTAALLLTPNYDNNAQVMEHLSPYQFFSLQNGATVNGVQPWLDRGGDSATISPNGTRAPGQVFLASAFNEVISYVDGKVLQSTGQGNVMTFVDRNGRPFNDPTISFVFNTARSSMPNYGAVLQNDKSGQGLINMGAHSSYGLPVLYPLADPAGGNQVWRIQVIGG